MEHWGYGKASAVIFFMQIAMVSEFFPISLFNYLSVNHGNHEADR